VAVRTKTRAVLVLTVALASLLIAGPAWADGLPLPSPVADAVTSAETAVQSTVGTATQPATEAITPVLEQTQPVIDETENVVPEPVRQLIGTVRSPVSQIPVRIATDAGPKPAAAAVRPGGKMVDVRPAAVSFSPQRLAEPVTSRFGTSSRSILERSAAQPTKRTTRPASAKPSPRSGSAKRSVVTTPPPAASVPSIALVLDRRDANRSAEASAAGEPTRAPVSPPRDRDSLVAAASAAAAGSDLGKTVGLVGLLGLFLTPILLNAIRAEMGPFREPFLRRRARPG
jgi:hypothetical protein